MPSIDELKEKKRFKKKAYRPWNLLDERTTQEVSAGNSSEELSSACPADALSPQDQITSTQIGLPPSNIPNQIDSKSPAEGQQLDSKQPRFNEKMGESKSQQIDSKSPAERQPKNPLDSNWTPDWTAGRQQKDSKSPAERQQLDSGNWSVDALSGKEVELVHLLFNRCKNAGSRQTEKLSTHNLCEALKVSTRRLRNLVERLVAKNILFVSSSKRGNGSWRQFALPNAVYQEMALNHLDSKSPAERQQLDSNWTPDWTATKTAEPSSSSSSLRSISNKELLTTGKQVSSETEMDALWQTIDSSPLKDFQFGRSQVTQIAQSGRVTPEQLQESIYAFAFDLTENHKAKSISGAPLNYFMGILRKGPYTPPANYESPEERQQRLYLEAKEQQRKLRQEQEARLETVEFEDWAEKLSLDERAGFVPPKDYAKPGGTAHTMQLREYFRENVWPQLRERLKVPSKRGST